jgi:hypothetical protein
VTPCLRSGKLRWVGRKERVPSAHLRWWYETHVGPLEPGEQVHHICGNPWCVAPDHLEALSFVEHVRAHRYGGQLPYGFDETAFAAG